MYTDEVAELYALEHDGFDDDVHLYLSYALRTGGPLLELGCGTGRLMAPLLEDGYEVTGVDSSPAMLARARRRLQPYPQLRWRLIEAELPDLSTSEPEQYALAYCALNTWAHLAEPDEALRSLQAVRLALRPAGLLLLDLEDPERWSPGRGELVLAGAWRQGEQVVTKVVSSLYDPASGTEHVTFLWDRVGDGALRRTLSRTRMRPYRRPELEQLLARAGFAVDECLGSWEMEPYAGRGDRLILVASRVG